MKQGFLGNIFRVDKPMFSEIQGAWVRAKIHKININVFCCMPLYENCIGIP